MNFKTTKLLLISTLECNGELIEPIGLEYLASYLIENNYKTEILCTFPNTDSINLIINQIVKCKPSVIGFSIWDINSEFVIRTSKEIKAIFPELIIIVGGYKAKFLSKTSISAIDYFIIGEGENATLKLLNSIENKNILKGKVIKSKPLLKLDNLPFPARELVDYDKFPLIPELKNSKNLTNHYTYIFTYRGCPNFCSFCAVHEVFGTKIRKRSIENIVDELTEIYEKYQINTFINEEDLLFTDKKRVINLCNAIKNSKYDFVWTCSGAVRYIDEEILLALKEAGCIYVFIGAISGSDEVLREAKAGFRVKDLLLALQTAKNVGMPISSSFMIGFPNETEESLTETLNFITDYRDLFWDVGIGIVTPYTGTPIMKEKLENSTIDDKTLENFINRNKKLFDFTF